MNNALFVLWAFIVLLTILVAVLAILGLVKWVGGYTVTVSNTTTKCEPSFETLPDISSLQCCVVAGNLTPNKYLSSIDMVVSNSATPYTQACAGFCTNGVNSNDTTKCINGAGQDAYDGCIRLVKPISCVGTANPVAHLGINYYYAFSATEASCSVKQAC